jgi:isoleucyl-tRNA synthetase
VLAHPTAEYVLLDLKDKNLKDKNLKDKNLKDKDLKDKDLKDKKVIVGAAVADALCGLIGVEKKVLKVFSAQDLQGARAQHPFLSNQSVPIILDDSVGTQEGTAFVHCAPGCGPIDYEIGVKNRLEIYSPITPDGRYSEDVAPQELVGLPISQGQGWAITQLLEQGNLLHKGSLMHSYPHCWRCLQGLIFRATPQWFFNLEKDNVQKRALAAIEKIPFLPEQGKNFLKATVAHRWEWCLSRQRVWGIPIPALLCKECDFAFISPEFIEKVAQKIQTQGIEYWDQVSLEELISQGIICANCNKQDFKKEQDILDVWFDSGVTHYSVLLHNPELAFPADVYLEGVDQHRGWFQSSLLTSMVLEEEACTKTIMAHGYTVDAKGQKMSKSKGNVVLPEDIINQIGTDGLRLWVASIGLESDPTVSPALLQNVAEVQRKIRNTCRFLLSVLYDFNKEQDALAPENLLPIDKRALEYLYQLNNRLVQEYKKASFTGVAHELADYCTVELSARYFDIIKDRLYVEEPTGRLRRSAQTACWHILDTLTKLMAPILSFTAELVTDAYQKNKTTSIHLQQFTQPYQLAELVKTATVNTPEVFQLFTQELEQAQILVSHDAEWTALYSVRSLVLKAIELLREQAIVKQSMEAHVTLFIDLESKRYESLKPFIAQCTDDYSLEQFLKEFFIVSGVTLSQSPEGLPATAHTEVFIAVKKAEGTKCPRCWQWDTQSDERQLCRRCSLLVPYVV